MKSHFLLGILIVFLFFISCNSENERKSHFEFINDISFPLDSLSIYESRSFQYVEMGKKAYFAVLNKYRNALYFYDFSKKNLDFVWKFPTEGPNSIPGISYFQYINSDTIFLINGMRKLYIIDSSRVVKQIVDALNLNWKDQKEPLSDILWTTSYAPLVYDYPNIILHGLIFGMKNAKLQCVYNLDEHQFSQKLTYPRNEYYTSKQRLFMVFYAYFSAFNSLKNSIVYSFPASEYIYLVDNNKMDSFLLKPNHSDVLKPYFTNTTASKEEYLLAQAEAEYYSTILYDKYNNLYYRFYVLRNDNPNVSIDEKIENRDRLLLVADSSGHKLFETTLSGTVYEFGQMFIAPNGLYICNKEKSQINEDSVYYSHFKIKLF